MQIKDKNIRFVNSADWNKDAILPALKNSPIEVPKINKTVDCGDVLSDFLPRKGSCMSAAVYKQAQTPKVFMGTVFSVLVKE